MTTQRSYTPSRLYPGWRDVPNGLLRRPQNQPMLGVGVDCRLAKGQLKRRTLVPGVELVFVMRAEQMPGFPNHDIERRSIEIGKVHRESLGRSQICADLLDRA